jgi:hypothetical protein
MTTTVAPIEHSARDRGHSGRQRGGNAVSVLADLYSSGGGDKRAIRFSARAQCGAQRPVRRWRC